MATREQIRGALDFLALVTSLPPVLHVPLADLPLWAAEMDADEVDVSLRYDGRVDATVTKYFVGRGHLIIDTTADAVRDMELPPCPEGAGFGQSVRLPVSEVGRLELLSAREVA